MVPPRIPTPALAYAYNWYRADETEHAAVSIDDFTLPPDKAIPDTLPSGEKALRVAKWKWLDTEWKPVVKPNETDSEGWIYTDNTWKNPGPTEAFGKYTVPSTPSPLPISTEI